MQLGIEDPETWLDAQTDEKLALWQGYFEVEPHGSEWERHAQQMAMLDRILGVNINCNLPKGETPYKARSVDDFLPDGWQESQEPQSAGLQMAAVAAASNREARVTYGDND